jgi:protein-L-isoaspartate O-methyltransferase
MIIPIGAKGRQSLLRVTRHGDEVVEEDLLAVSFVPLVEGTEL